MPTKRRNLSTQPPILLGVCLFIIVLMSGIIILQSKPLQLFINQDRQSTTVLSVLTYDPHATHGPFYSLNSDINQGRPSDSSDFDPSRIKIDWTSSREPLSAKIFGSLARRQSLSPQQFDGFLHFFDHFVVRHLGRVIDSGKHHRYQNWEVYSLDGSYDYYETFATYPLNILLSPDQASAVFISPILEKNNATPVSEAFMATRQFLDPFGVIPVEHDLQMELAPIEGLPINEHIVLRTASHGSLRVLDQQLFSSRYPGCYPTQACQALLQEHPDITVATTTVGGSIIYKNVQTDGRNEFQIIAKDGFVYHMSGNDLPQTGYTAFGNCQLPSQLTQAQLNNVLVRANQRFIPVTNNDKTVLIFKKSNDPLLGTLLNGDQSDQIYNNAFDLPKHGQALTPAVFFTKNAFGDWVMYVESRYCPPTITLFSSRIGHHA